MAPEWLVPIPDPRPIWSNWRAFSDELRRLGHVDGETVTYDVWSLAGEARAPLLEAILERPDVIVTRGPNWIRQLMTATSNIPIVVFEVPPIEQGIVLNLSRPEANVTGFSSRPGPEFDEKQLQILMALAPNIRRVGWISGGSFGQGLGDRAYDSVRSNLIGSMAQQGIDLVLIHLEAMPPPTQPEIDAGCERR